MEGGKDAIGRMAAKRRGMVYGRGGGRWSDWTARWAKPGRQRTGTSPSGDAVGPPSRENGQKCDAGGEGDGVGPDRARPVAAKAKVMAMTAKVMA